MNQFLFRSFDKPVQRSGEINYSETPNHGPSNLGQKKDRTSLTSDFRHSAGILLVKSRGCRNNDAHFWKPRRNMMH